MGVIWITGLPNSGKSTLAEHVQRRLAESIHTPVLFDGDRLREILPHQPGYAERDRRKLARFYSRLAQTVSEQGHEVICATVSLFNDVHAWNRQNIDGYFEVLVVAPPEDRLRRDSRGIYASAEHVVGQDIPAELPIAPDLVISNPDGADIADAAVRVAAAFTAAGVIR